jgi:hypothetical protein
LVEAGTRRVNEHDIQITMDAAMLKTIIEHKDLGRRIDQGDGGDPVGADRDRDSIKSFLVFRGFIRESGGGSTVSTERDGWSPSRVLDLLHDPSAHRRLSGASGSEVPHGNHRHAETNNSSPGIESTTSDLHDRFEAPTRRS